MNRTTTLARSVLAAALLAAPAGAEPTTRSADAAALQAKLDAADARIAELEREVADLRARLGGATARADEATAQAAQATARAEQAAARAAQADAAVAGAESTARVAAVRDNGSVRSLKLIAANHLRPGVTTADEVRAMLGEPRATRRDGDATVLNYRRTDPGTMVHGTYVAGATYSIELTFDAAGKLTASSAADR